MLALGAIVFVSVSSTAFTLLLKFCNGEYNEPSVQEFLEENKPRSVRKCKPF